MSPLLLNILKDGCRKICYLAAVVVISNLQDRLKVYI